MINLNRRGFLGGLISAIAAPAITCVNYFNPYKNISMRIITEYIPINEEIVSLDILYGTKILRNEWK